MSGATSGLTDSPTNTISSKSLSTHPKTRSNSIASNRSNLKARSGPKIMSTLCSMSSSQLSPTTDLNISQRKA